MIVKEKHLEKIVETFRGKEVKITKEVKGHLQAVTGNEAYKKSFTILLVDECVERLKLLSKIAEPESSKVQIKLLLRDLLEN